MRVVLLLFRNFSGSKGFVGSSPTVTAAQGMNDLDIDVQYASTECNADVCASAVRSRDLEIRLYNTWLQPCWPGGQLRPRWNRVVGWTVCL